MCMCIVYSLHVYVVVWLTLAVVTAELPSILSAPLVEVYGGGGGGPHIPCFF